MRLLSLVALACILLLAGCGEASEEDKIKQAFNDYVAAVKDKDGEKFCDSIASPELVKMSRDERAKEIRLCKQEFSAKDFGELSDKLGDTKVGKITVNGDRATAEVTGTVNGKKQSGKTPFLKLDGDWKVTIESR